MNLPDKLKRAAFAALFCGASLMASAVVAQQAPGQQQAQQNFTDQELQQFANATSRLMQVQQAGEQEMIKILQEEKLSVDKFNELAMAQQQQKTGEVKASEEEKAAFDKAAQRMIALQPAMQKNAETAILQDGMTLEKYEQIMLAYRQDPALQERVNKLIEEKH